MGLEPFISIRNWFSQSSARISNLPFIFVLLFLMVFFWITGNSWFPNWSSTYGDMILIYIGMTIIFLVWSAKGTQKQMRRSIKDSMTVFVLFFIGTYVILLLVSATGAITPAELNPDLYWQTIIINVVVVACAEELMFRGVLLELTNIPIQAIAFALFHSWAYGVRFYEVTWETFPWQPMIFALVMGILLGFVAKEPHFGIVACVSIHSAYNIFVSGGFYSLGTTAIIIILFAIYEKRRKNEERSYSPSYL